MPMASSVRYPHPAWTREAVKVVLPEPDTAGRTTTSSAEATTAPACRVRQVSDAAAMPFRVVGSSSSRSGRDP